MFFVRLLVIGLWAGLGIAMGQAPDLNAFGKLMVWSLLLTVPALYMLPTYEAWRLQHPKIAAIATLNVLAGWTLVGWIGAVVWALTYTPAETKPTTWRPLPPATRKCPFCAEEILAEAKICKHCRSEVT